MKLYIAVLDEFPDYMTPTLVAHATLAAHLKFKDDLMYDMWLNHDFRKCVVRVSQKEFDKIAELANVHLGYESTILNGRNACAVVCPDADSVELPNVLKFAKLWKPKYETY